MYFLTIYRENLDVMFYLFSSLFIQFQWDWKTFLLSVYAKFAKVTKPGDQGAYGCEFK